MEVPAGQVNFRGSLPCSENNVLQPMLHPVRDLHFKIFQGFESPDSTSTDLVVSGILLASLLHRHLAVITT